MKPTLSIIMKIEIQSGNFSKLKISSPFSFTSPKIEAMKLRYGYKKLNTPIACKRNTTDKNIKKYFLSF